MRSEAWGPLSGWSFRHLFGRKPLNIGSRRVRFPQRNKAFRAALLIFMEERVKLFLAVAAAALLSLGFLAATPDVAEAKKGWGHGHGHWKKT
jgi:hypothetical protein